MNAPLETLEARYDVVICGGGLAGLTLSLQLRQEMPQLSVAVVDRLARPLPDAAHKVGESSVELGSQYLESLGLRDYLLDQHIVKYGLRFFPGGGKLPIEKRAELAPSREPPYRSYQLDRGRFENDLRDMAVARGVTLVEGCKVQGVTWGQQGADHSVSIAQLGSDQSRDVSAHWVVDATGRAALLRSEMKLKRGTGHTAHSGWFRVKGRVDVTQIVPRTDATKEWHDQVDPELRWRSTNHFMGEGYWVWLIPLSSGNTSVGIVTHDQCFDFGQVRSLERCMDFLRENEPYIAARMEDAEVLDFKCLTSYSHNVTRAWSDQRWALVGEAGAFVDPLYSPGTDFIALANSFTLELIRVEQTGGDLSLRTRELNVQYRALVMGAVGLYEPSSKTYGHARAMTTKIYWDNFSYWSFLCQFFLQKLYRESGENHMKTNMLGARYVELSNYIQRLCAAWARLSPEDPPAGFVEMPDFPSLCVEAHLDLGREMTPEETFAYMEHRLVQSERMAAEITIRVMSELGPEATAELVEELHLRQLGLELTAERLEAEKLSGMEYRKAIGPVGRDIAANIGRTNRHADWEEALALLPVKDEVRPVPEPLGVRELTDRIAAIA